MSMRAPRPTRNQPLTPWGRYLQAERLARGRSQKEAFNYFRETYPEAFGWGEESVTAYGNLERGPGLPSAAMQAAFLAEYGHAALPEAYSQAEVETDPIARLAAAMEIQNALWATALGLLTRDAVMTPEARGQLDAMIARATAPSTSPLPTESHRP